MASLPDVSAFYADKKASTYIMQQTMVRVKDPVKSLEFYTKVPRSLASANASTCTNVHVEADALITCVHCAAALSQVLGMNLLFASDFPQWGFSVYFVGYVDPSIIPADTTDRWTFCSKIPGTVELTWNHGSEKEEAPRIYNTGNGDTVGTADGQRVKGGFGHLGISVPDVYEACERFKEHGVRPPPH